MWHRVEVVLTDVSEERIDSIFRVEGKIRKSSREASVRDVKSRHQSAFNVSDGRFACGFACGFSYFPLYPEDGGDTFLRNVG
jgi:hypothetical protein